MTIEERYELVFLTFEQLMPDAQTELHYSNPYELLVAVILSAQCTDKRVNMVTPALFAHYPTPQDLALATPEALFPYIKSVSYPNSKTQHLIGMARKVVTDFGGKIPQTREELMTLPGVGRKTANVMLIVAFDTPAMPVDTHVHRVSARLGLTHDCKTPEQTEQQLLRHISPERLNKAHHYLILFGRKTCKALRPQCNECELRKVCIAVNQ